MSSPPPGSYAMLVFGYGGRGERLQPGASDSGGHLGDKSAKV